MLEIVSKFICCTIMCVTGFKITNNIIDSGETICSNRNIILTLLTVIVQVLIHKYNYSITNTLLILISTIVFHKIVFKISYTNALIYSGIYTIILFFSDIIIATLLSFFFTMDEIRQNFLLMIFSNIIISIGSISIINIKVINTQIRKFVDFTKKKNKVMNILFIGLLILCFICLGHNITSTHIGEAKYIVNFSIMITLAIISYIFIINKISYYQLSDEYDTLFSYVQHFEEWIEKEQLNRHEYKNQLAVLRCLTKEKKLIKKIDEILEDNINIKNEEVYKLKELPKGGLKGLMYYKVAIAQKNKLKIDIDVSLAKDKVLKKLTEYQQKTLCKLIGIYLDNAIEAATESADKLIVLEFYCLKNSSRIVISNSFDNSNIERRNERGYSTKGKGRGNGLYYASTILEKNNWITSSQQIIDKLYIQILEIKKD